MRLDGIEQISAVMCALYEKEFQAIRSVLAEESDLRGKLRQLDEQIAENRSTGANNHAMQVIGASFLWQGWTMRMRGQLNLELAQVMAKKLIAMDRVRVAFGRQQAVGMMTSAEHAAQKKRKVKQQEAALLAMR